MGDYRNISRLSAISISVLFVWIGASVASADDAVEALAGPSTTASPAAPPARSSDANPDHTSVSMPPTADPAGLAVARTHDESRVLALPLTRAAAREQIDRMSPRDWLANYGRVVVGRPD